MNYFDKENTILNQNNIQRNNNLNYLGQIYKLFLTIILLLISIILILIT